MECSEKCFRVLAYLSFDSDINYPVSLKRYLSVIHVAPCVLDRSFTGSWLGYFLNSRDLQKKSRPASRTALKFI